MIRKINIIVFVFLLLSMNGFGQLTLKEQLEILPHVVSVNVISTDTSFVTQYELYFEQAIDHAKPWAGTFNQRVIVSHKSINQPVVCVLEGYNIWSGRGNELSQMLNANQINIEHRFFKDSRPDSIPWDNLTLWQAATDQHFIIQALQSIYKHNWLTTGISKGGQVTMFHKVFYPYDVSMGIPYVAPLNFAREDNRIYDFLNTVGTNNQRELIYNFQMQCLAKQDSLVLLLQEVSEERAWHFAFGLNKAFEYTVLEYPFAFWQWGFTPFDEIPQGDVSADSLFNHLHEVADFTFFEDAAAVEMHPFFWSALTEIGMYGYKTEPFEKYLGDTLYTFDFSAPPYTQPVYHPEVKAYMKEQLDLHGDNMLYIVGGLDPWGATAFVPNGENNAIRMTLENGHHGTRILDFSEKDQATIYKLIEEWMGLPVNSVK